MLVSGSGIIIMAFLRPTSLILILWIARTGADIETFYLDTELCNQKINMSSYDDHDLHSFRLKLSEQHYYPHNLDCQLQIQAQRDSENIMFYFKYFDVRPYAHPESYCIYDWLEIHDGNSTDSPYVCGVDMKLCGISPSRTMGVYFTRSNYLTLYFKSDDQEKYTGFEMIITRFRYGQCRSDEYACANGRCIDQSLQCNGYNACGDRSGCNNLHPGYIMTIVAAGVVVILTIAVIVLGILLCRKQKSTKIVPQDKIPLNPQMACSSLKEGLRKYGTENQRPIRQPSESTDRSNQAPLNSILDPPSTYISSHFGGAQSQTLPGNTSFIGNGDSIEHSLPNWGSIEHSSHGQEDDSRLRQRNRSKREDRHSAELHHKQGVVKRSNTEPTLDEGTCDQDTTHPKRMCSCGNLRPDIPNFGIRDNHLLDSGYSTPRPGPVNSCLDTTYPKTVYHNENTEAKRLYIGCQRRQGTPVRGEFDSDKIASYQNSINFR